jgi:hypothetical protein
MPEIVLTGVMELRRPTTCGSEAGETDYNTALDNLTGFIDSAVAHKVWLIILLHRVDDNSPRGVSISISSVLLRGMANYTVNHEVSFSHELGRVDDRKPKRTEFTFYIPAIGRVGFARARICRKVEELDVVSRLQMHLRHSPHDRCLPFGGENCPHRGP